MVCGVSLEAVISSSSGFRGRGIECRKQGVTWLPASTWKPRWTVIGQHLCICAFMHLWHYPIGAQPPAAEYKYGGDLSSGHLTIPTRVQIMLSIIIIMYPLWAGLSMQIGIAL